MPLSPGTLLGPYEIVALLGEGGMGVVYRAHDPRLNRDVAIKILRDDAAFSEDRKRRFIQEAKSASALNSANIVHIYDIGQADGVSYIAMELVHGKTLDRLIGKSGLSLRDTLKYAIQIADALTRAHAAGIVHRDLKPSNIVISDDGGVKLLDFGLAKLTETVPDPGNSATATLQQPEAPLTEEGAIVGTLAYMSPEQAEGKPVDARSDIFSFGAVLYEMATGRRAFQGGSRAAILAAVLHSEPEPLAEIAPDLPDDLQKIVARCLRKDSERRSQHIGDVKVSLEDLKDDSLSGKLFVPGRDAPAPSRRPLVFAALATAVLLLLAGGYMLLRLRTPAAPTRADWVQITNLPDPVGQPALSPDGRMVAFVRGPSTFTTPGQVFIKLLPSGEPVQLTHDPSQKMGPAFSPDGSRVAYTSLVSGAWDTWDVPVLGGQPRRWLPNASGLVWIDPANLLFSEIKQGMHMAIVTSQETRAASRDVYVPTHQRGMAHRSYPSPDRKSILVVEMNEFGHFPPCRVLPLDGSSIGRPVGPANGHCTSAAWSPDGQWMYFSSDAGGAFHAWRQRFPDGSPDQLTSGPTEEEGIAMAPDGRSFLTAVGLTQSSVWLHDAGGERQISLEGRAGDPRFTPDHKRLLYVVGTGVAAELRIVDLESGRAESLVPRIRTGQGSRYDLSPDGSEVVFASFDSSGKPHLWLASLDRHSPPKQIPGADGDSPVFGSDGEIFFRKLEGDTLFAYGIHKDGSALRKLSAEPIIGVSGISPDKRWITAVGSRGMRGSGLAISTTGEPSFPLPAFHHRWSSDGKHWFWGNDASNTAGTYVVPLRPGEIWARDASGVVPADRQEAAKLPGARLLPLAVVVPGATADVYAFTKTTVERNLYRIPVP